MVYWWWWWTVMSDQFDSIVGRPMVFKKRWWPYVVIWRDGQAVELRWGYARSAIQSRLWSMSLNGLDFFGYPIRRFEVRSHFLLWSGTSWFVL